MRRRELSVLTCKVITRLQLCMRSSMTGLDRQSNEVSFIDLIPRYLIVRGGWLLSGMTWRDASQRDRRYSNSKRFYCLSISNICFHKKITIIQSMQLSQFMQWMDKTVELNNALGRRFSGNWSLRRGVYLSFLRSSPQDSGLILPDQDQPSHHNFPIAYHSSLNSHRLYKTSLGRSNLGSYFSQNSLIIASFSHPSHPLVYPTQPITFANQALVSSISSSQSFGRTWRHG